MPPSCPTPNPDDLAARVELQPASPAAKGNALAALVRWARAVRDRERQGQPARPEPTTAGGGT
jgi:hypothetical protein